MASMHFSQSSLGQDTKCVCVDLNAWIPLDLTPHYLPPVTFGLYTHLYYHMYYTYSYTHAVCFDLLTVHPQYVCISTTCTFDNICTCLVLLCCMHMLLMYTWPFGCWHVVHQVNDDSGEQLVIPYSSKFSWQNIVLRCVIRHPITKIFLTKIQNGPHSSEMGIGFATRDH